MMLEVSWKRTAAAVFHPDANEDAVKTECGWVRVIRELHDGKTGYLLNTGEFVEV